MKLRIGIIGAGVVGTAVGVILSNRGYEVTGGYDINPESTKTWNQETGLPVWPAAEELAGQADVLFITTNDGSIRDVVHNLAAAGAVRKGQVFIHMSGALTSDVMSEAGDLGAVVLSIHPLQSFASVERAIANLPGSVFSVEGDPLGLPLAEELVGAMGGEFFVISKEAKPLYHAGACVVSNYLVTLIDFGTRFLEMTGMSRKTAEKALMPLIAGTIQNIDRIGIPRALTGPIARGDMATILKHLNCLKKMAPDLLQLYSLLGFYTAEVASRKGTIDRGQEWEFKKVFEPEMVVAADAAHGGV